MKKYAAILAAVVLFIFVSVVSVFADDIVWDDIGRGNLNLRTVLVNPDNPKIIYVGSSNAVLKSEDNGRSWKTLLSIRGQNKAVNFLLFEPKDKNSLYVATGNGLFYGSAQGNNWHRIFRGKNYLENECTTLAVSPFGIYLGTKSGLLVSKDNGRSWYKESGMLGNSHILNISYNLSEPDYIYIVSLNGAFKTSDAGKNWERIFVAHAVEDGDKVDEISEDRDEEERFSGIRCICVDPNNTDYLYIATNGGIYISKDRGKTWEAMTDYGLLNRDTEFILISLKSNIYALTRSGVFEYRNERWYELSLGLVAENIMSLALDNQGNLYAACNNGLFKADLQYSGGDKKDNLISFYYKDEPKINEVREAAINYAEVDFSKIKEWRKKAKLKAILPKLTVGLDRSESTNYEIYTSATTKYIYEGPYDKSNGWDVTLSWELSDLIWNEAQISIDVRSRLMTQLRDDILDEVTKLYFERMRVKMELDNLSIEDRKKRFEKELRLQELAASLDALTGGYFSQQIKTARGS